MISQTEKQVLHDIYYDISHPAGYGSVNALYNAAKKQLPKLTIKKVLQYLQTQDTYTLHKPIKKKFTRRKTLAPYIDAIWQADLISLIPIKKENSNKSYILSCIDIVSRYAFAEPLKSKSNQDVIQAFTTIFNRSKRKPVKLQTDLGKEFWGKKAQSFFKSMDIIHYSSHSDLKAAVIERWNRTLKNRMFKYFEQNVTLRYIDNLQNMVRAYNLSPHRSLKNHSPSEVNRKNQKYFWCLQFPIKKVQKPAFKVGDFVRISRYPETFRKGYLKQYTTEIFTIEKIKNTNPICYVIKDSNGEIIEGVFYKQELSKVMKNG